MSRSVFLPILAWVKVRICFVGHVRIGRAHADDDVGVCGRRVWPGY